MFMFDSDVAMIVSTDAAVVFQNIVHWIEKNYANKNNFYDGDYWTYNSAEAFSKLFPFLTKRQMERILKELRDNDLIKTGNDNAYPGFSERLFLGQPVFDKIQNHSMSNFQPQENSRHSQIAQCMRQEASVIENIFVNRFFKRLHGMIKFVCFTSAPPE